MVTLSTLLPLLRPSSSRCWARIQLRLHHIHLLRDPHYDLLLHVSALSDARLGLGDEAGEAQGEAIDTIDTGPTNGEEACKGQTVSGEGIRFAWACLTTLCRGQLSYILPFLLSPTDDLEAW